MPNPFLFLGAVNGFLAVAIGAFGAHALRGQLQGDYYQVFQTGVHYHGLHALALVALGVAAPHLPPKWLNRTGWLLLAGILLFSGSLYLLAITGIRPFGMVTPVGGVCFLLAWVCFAIAAYRAPGPKP